MSPFDTLPQQTFSVEEERGLARRYKKTGDEDAVRDLVMNNMRQAVLYARRICNDAFDDGELISICYRTLLRQAKRYDPDRGLAFFTFAKIGVRGDVHRNFRQLDALKNSKRVHSPNETDGMTDKDETVDCAESVAVKDDAKFALRSIRRCCNEREQAIFALTYFGGLGFYETAVLLGVSRAAVQAAHARALNKVRLDCQRTERLFDGANTSVRPGDQVRSSP